MPTASARAERLPRSRPAISRHQRREYAALLGGGIAVRQRQLRPRPSRSFPNTSKTTRKVRWSPRPRLASAACLEAEGKSADAIQKYQSIISAYPSDINITGPAKLTLARLYEQANRPDQALTFYSELARSQNPYDPWAAEARERGELLLAKHPELRRAEAAPAAAAPAPLPFRLPVIRPSTPPPPRRPPRHPRRKQSRPASRLNLLNFPAAASNAHGQAVTPVNLSVIGTGYVGLVTGTCFAEVGHNVICVDKDAEKVKLLQAGGMPIYEPGLEELVEEKHRGRPPALHHQHRAKGVEGSDVIFIAVPTPPHAGRLGGFELHRRGFARNRRGDDRL